MILSCDDDGDIIMTVMVIVVLMIIVTRLFNWFGDELIISGQKKIRGFCSGSFTSLNFSSPVPRSQ